MEIIPLPGHVLLQIAEHQNRNKSDPGKDVGVFFYSSPGGNNKTKMIMDLKRIRFTLSDTQKSLSLCYWYMQAQKTIVPIGEANNSDHAWPDCIHT